jgi:hypothetical protein
MATLLRTVVSAFLLLALLVSAKCMLENHLAPTTSGIHGAMLQPKIDILLIGSSHTRQGYDVKELEQATGRSVFVVAYDGLDPANMLPLVNMFLRDPAKRPQLLVIEANEANLHREPDIEEPRLFFDAPPSLKRDLVQAYLHNHHGRTAYLNMWTLIANRGSETILTWPLLHWAVDNLSYHGSYKYKNVAGMSVQDFPSALIPVGGSSANPDQVEALRQIARIAAARHVPLLAAAPPMPAPAEAQPEIVSLHKQLGVLAAADHIPYYDGTEGFPLQDPTLFHDSNHLSSAGRELYTQRFAEFLQHGVEGISH